MIERILAENWAAARVANWVNYSETKAGSVNGFEGGTDFAISVSTVGLGFGLHVIQRSLN